MSEWVVEWLWVGLYWLAASVVLGLVAGWLMRAGGGEPMTPANDEGES